LSYAGRWPTWRRPAPALPTSAAIPP
jgi:hypothetical protein